MFFVKYSFVLISLLKELKQCSSIYFLSYRPCLVSFLRHTEKKPQLQYRTKMHLRCTKKTGRHAAGSAGIQPDELCLLTVVLTLSAFQKSPICHWLFQQAGKISTNWPCLSLDSPTALNTSGERLMPYPKIPTQIFKISPLSMSNIWLFDITILL